jgi:hypothetical protein
MVAGAGPVSARKPGDAVPGRVPWGFRRGPDSRDGRQRPVYLTARGRELLRSVERIYAELEAEWAGVIGVPHIQRMRRDLVQVLAGPSGELPPVRPTW